VNNLYAEIAVAEAWSVVSDELVAIIREGGNTKWAVDFQSG
jgi:hypothetical protein